MTATSEDTCKEVRKNFDDKFVVTTKRLDSHSGDITDLKLIMATLTQLQVTNTAQLSAMETRIKELEISKRNHRDDIRLIADPPREQTFFDSAAGLLIIKGTFGLAVIVILAAIGQNVNPEFLSGLFGK